MKISRLVVENFRGYKEKTTIKFDNLTAFIGKNDVGKSTILEALDIFFNDGNGTIKIDKDDINKNGLSEGNNTFIIAVSFIDLPKQIIIDENNLTNLTEEYLLNENNELEIIKEYTGSSKGTKIYINANHPTQNICNELLLKKEIELRTIIKNNNIQCPDLNRNATMRKSIWTYFSSDLNLQPTMIDISKGEARNIYEKIKKYFPAFLLFQSDRKNSDSDAEVQDPLKEAVKSILSEQSIREKLTDIANEVQNKLNNVAHRTLEKLKEMNSSIAESLKPEIPKPDSLKWHDVFKSVTISGDEGIPINKRGSGVRRLILLNFFRAEAERKLIESNAPGIIYAIEEPETSQHLENQKILINSFKIISEIEPNQIIITTHSGSIVRELKLNNIRIIADDENDKKIIVTLSKKSLPYLSLDEINFLAFGDVTIEYFNELYGFLKQLSSLGYNFFVEKPKIRYNRLDKNGNIHLEYVTIYDYIRHQIHHPENTHNQKYTQEELKNAIIDMRNYIENISS